MSRTDVERSLSNRLRECRVERGLEQWQVAEALAALARHKGLGEIGLDAHAVSRHERGLHRPSRRYRSLYCLLYEAGEIELWPRHRCEDLIDDPVLSAGWNQGGTVEAAVALTESGGFVERRTFLLSVTGAALTAPAHQWLIHEPGPLVSALNGDRVTEGLADRLPAMVAELRAMDDAQGGGLVLSLAQRQFAWVAELLDKASYDDVTARKLHVALAELGQFAGWVAYNAGRHDALAQRYYVAALRAAHTTDDRALGAHILRSMADQAAEQNRPAEAVTLIETALVGAPGRATPNLLAALHIEQAYVNAKLGDQVACMKAIGEARTHVERIDGENDPPWLYWVNRADIIAGAGNSLLQLGRADQAMALLDEGIHLFDDAFVRERQLRLTHLAEALARPGPQRDLDAAAHRATEAIELAESLSSARSVDRIHSLAQQLQPYENVPAVRDFLERARGFLVR